MVPQPPEMVPQPPETVPQPLETVPQPLEMVPQPPEMAKQHCGTISVIAYSNNALVFKIFDSKTGYALLNHQNKYLIVLLI